MIVELCTYVHSTCMHARWWKIMRRGRRQQWRRRVGLIAHAGVHVECVLLLRVEIMALRALFSYPFFGRLPQIDDVGPALWANE